uniref:WGS project CAEQ00000000 data, annotated contig 1818 n=1 Tax=Trypanosoma congolense (strain IL3000) TaxID=1068625 RepID=F9W954_TRYCI|nr:unnamed protein product [Trypanosoma congolense IL3000]
MFHKKHIVKEQIFVGKKDARKIWEALYGFIGEENLECLESFWRRSDPVSRVEMKFSAGGCAAVFLVNQIPLAMTVSRLPEEADDTLSGRPQSVIPTLYTLLLMKLYYKGKNIDTGSFFGAGVFCRGPTSKYIISGAHLMMPGIVERRVRGDASLSVGDLVFVYSLGNLCPYAVGFATDNLVNLEEFGRGVYVVHCYKDYLWNSYHTMFCGLCPPTLTLPATFKDNEVCEVASSQANCLCDDVGETHPDRRLSIVTDVASESYTENEEIMESAAEIFSVEDNVLDFALCEAIKELSQSRLPLALGEFIPLLLSNFPRFRNKRFDIDFKRTKYKKALSYLLQRGEVISVSEVTKGNFFVTEVNKASVLYCRHRQIYCDFLREFHVPLKGEEDLASDQRTIKNGSKKEIKRRIKSIETLYSPKGRRMLNLQRLLCTGCVPNQPDCVVDVGETSDGHRTYSEVGSDDDFLGKHYSRKHLNGALRKYITSQNILRLGEKGEIPRVLLDPLLAPLLTDSVAEIPITELEDLVITKLFTPVTEILLETTHTVDGASLSGSSISRLIKKGTLPKLLLYSEKRAGRKVVTIVTHLDDYGFELVPLSNLWKQQLSTACTVVDPSKEMLKVKPGTKVSLELHLGGNWVPKLKAILERDLGFPQHLITIRGE